MFEPQSLLLFFLLIFIFGGLTWWLVRVRHLAVRIVAACLSFVVAVQFGILAVNKYFGYYATWGAAIADFSNQSTNAGPQISEGSLLAGNRTLAFDPRAVYLRLALQQGYTLRLTVPGKLSHITRTVYVYLPPQYFESQYANYRFPVIELIHGEPGEPQDWINVVGIQVTLDDMIRHGQAKPVVLVMPDANGGHRISLQCLNQVGGAQDLTYLGVDVPQAISRVVRVQPPGRAWGIAGYSEGGYCAANMALRYRYRYGFAASMSGYFSPMSDQLINPTRSVDPFRGNKVLRAQNTPTDEVRQLAPGATLPQFWLGAGQGDKADTSSAEYFAQELQLHLANVPLVLTPGGGHTMGTWHAEVPPMLAWMSNGLAGAAAKAASLAKAKAVPTAPDGQKPAGPDGKSPTARPSARK